MEIIGAAALIAVGIVAAAVVYGRSHVIASAVVPAATASVSALEAGLPERPAAPARGEDALARRETELAQERRTLTDERQGVHRELERISGLSAAKAKQLLLDEIEGQARHDAARRIRQIEGETKREAESRVGNIPP